MKKLVLELNKKINLANKNKANKVEETFFVKNDKREISMYGLNDGITPKQRAQVVALANFIQENKNLSQEELNQVLSKKFFKFAFLRSLNKRVPNLAEELLERGAIYVLGKYQESVVMDMLNI